MNAIGGAATTQTTTILIARHGHVEGISPERFRGRADVALTPEGTAQARALAQGIGSEQHPVAIYTSPLLRCVETAAPIGRECGVTPRVFDALIDIDYGAWGWATVDEMKEHSPETLALWYGAPQLVRFPSGESLQDVATRAADSVRFVMKHHSGERVLVVSHDTVIRVMLLQLLGSPLEFYWRVAQEPCALNEVTLSGAAICVRRMNVTFPCFPFRQQ